MEFRRKLYRRGSSFETTIPKPILFAIDPSKKQEVVFTYDAKNRLWCLTIEEIAADIRTPGTRTGGRRRG